MKREVAEGTYQVDYLVMSGGKNVSTRIMEGLAKRVKNLPAQIRGGRDSNVRRIVDSRNDLHPREYRGRAVPYG